MNFVAKGLGFSMKCIFCGVKNTYNYKDYDIREYICPSCGRKIVLRYEDLKWLEDHPDCSGWKYRLNRNRG